MTYARQAVLICLADRQTPVSFVQMEHHQEIKGRLDASTLYRTVMILKTIDLVRQITVDHKLRYFTLNSPDESGVYLSCYCCGKITPLAAASVDEKRVEEAVSLGYAKVECIVNLSGLCLRCQTKPGINTPTSKLRIIPKGFKR